MVMLAVEDVHGELLIDQVNTVVPTVSPVIVDAGFVGVVIVPGPEIFTHKPVPLIGLLPASKALPTVTQIF